MRLGSLFDGIGGFPLAASRNGITPVWASEIEPDPIKVTKRHFPSMVHYGDVTQIHGGQIEPVDIITFGSPCQDLSVAGKRAGLDGERSGLFGAAVRIISEMRLATGGQYPRWAVWENVPGAFSSNKGEDFRVVIEELCRIKDPDFEVPPPPKGKWMPAGMVDGDGWSVAWRVLDAQYWGVPQRRKRIFLVTDFRGESAGEILFKQESLRRNTQAGSGEGERVAACTEGGAGEPSGVKCLTPWDCQSTRIFLSSGCYPTLQAMAGGGANNTAVLLDQKGEGVAVSIEAGAGGAIGFKANSSIADNNPVLTNKTPTLQTTSKIAVVYGISEQGETAHCLRSGASKADKHESTTYVVHQQTSAGFCPEQSAKTRGIGYEEEMSPTLRAGVTPAVVHPQITGTLCASGAGMSRPAGMASETDLVVAIQDTRGMDKKQNGRGYSEDGVSYTLDAMATQGVAYAYDHKDLGRRPAEFTEQSPTLKARAGTGGGNIPILTQSYAVRRLTPLECERLQGFPDGWTDGLSDTARYKALGNSVAIPCVEYIMEGLYSQWMLS